MALQASGDGNKASEGRQAYKDGLRRDQNPYPPGSSKYWQWSSGWLDEQAFRPRASVGGRGATPMMTDPRKAATLDEAARNPDGTYNGARALSWLSDVLTGGKGQTEDEVNRMFADAKAGKAKTAPAKGRCCSAAGVGRKSGAQGA